MTCNTCNECNPCEKEKKPCCELKVLAGDCVDVEEENWAYVVSATCPPEVVAWDWVEIETTDSPREWYSKRYTVNATDKKVWVCSDDTPWYLTTKIKWELPIKVETVWCESANGYMLIKLDEDILDVTDEKVAVGAWCEGKYLEDVLDIDSNYIKAQKVWCKLRITDKEQSIYDYNVCLWFSASAEKYIWVDNNWNAVAPTWIDRWNRRTWNKNMATRQWIKILEDWYYRVFWQLTVQNNTWDSDARNRWINLWRWLLKVENENDDNRKYILSTAKHWQYARQVILRWGEWISISDNWDIKYDDWWSGEWQNWKEVQWPWMTFNMDCYVDLKAGDIITVWYRAQSNMPEANWQTFYFTFPWEDDLTTTFQAVFGWSMVWVQMIAPRRFTDWDAYASF